MFCHLHLHTHFCLAGDTIVYNCVKHQKEGKFYRNDYTRLKNCKTIKHLWECSVGKGKGYTHKKYPIKVWNGERFIRSKIKGIVRSGIKQLYKITTESGKSIRASEDHKFLTDKGWVRVRDLAVGGSLGCNGQYLFEDYDWLKEKYESLNQEQIAGIAGVGRKVIGKWIKKFGLQKTKSEWMQGHYVNPETTEKIVAIKRGKRKIDEIPPSVYASRDRIARDWYGTKESCEICGATEALCVHHKDRDALNNSKENLQVLCQSCHRWEHSPCPLTVRYEKIVSIEKDLCEETFDIEVEHPAHNFVANGFVTHNSLLDGLGTPEQYIQKAKEIGQEYLGCTDHASIDSFLKFHTVAKEYGIKPVLGCELYIVENASLNEKGEDRHHVVVLIKNKTGFANVNKMLTIANTQHFYYKPRITPEILLAHSEGLVITSACASSFITRPWGIDLLTKLHKKQPGDVYLEVMPHDFDDQKKINELCVGINEVGIPLVATNDCHYVENGDETAHDALLALQTQKKLKDKGRWRFNVSGLYVRSEKEMQQAFYDQSVIPKRLYTQAMENTVEIAEKCCNFNLDKMQVELPSVVVFPGLSDEDTLKKLCTDSLRKKRLGTEYRARLKEELALITRQKMSRYFLIVYELINWCRQKGIMTGPGRGSSGGSLVCYLLGITAVDPLKHGLLFARFISPGRIDLPDIDMDFEDVRRPEIIEHLKQLYGEDNVAGVSSFVKMKSKLALRDASRVFDVPLKEVNSASATIISRGWGDDAEQYDITRAFEEFPDGQKFKKKYPEAVQVALKMENKVRSRGQHAAAVLISKDSLANGERGYLLDREKGRVINWEKNDIEHFGLMKLDVLGLNALSILNGAKKLISVDIDYESIPLNDKAVLDEFTKGNCIGVFQFGSPGIRKVCMDLGIDSFDMLVHANALYRPGTIYAGMVDEFIERRKGQPWSNLHPLLDRITGNTYGIFVYQEQVMLLLYELAGMKWETTDKVRKIISKSKGQEEFLKYKAEFVKGCVSRGTLDEDTAAEVYDSLSSMGSYAFNRSHSVEYSMIAYWMMYLKVYFPLEFICASLTYCTEVKKEDLVTEAKRMKIDIRPPKVGISEAEGWVIKNGVLYCPFIEIKGIGSVTSMKFLDVAKKKGFYEKPKKEGKTVAKYKQILQEIDAFNDVPLTDEQADRISPLFGFSFLRDSFLSYKHILGRLAKSKNFNSGIPDEGNKGSVSFAKIVRLKFGGTAESPQVMGDLVDQTTKYHRFVLDKELYRTKRDLVDHCADKFCLVQTTSDKNRIIINDMWSVEEVMACEFMDAKLDVIRRKRFKTTNDLVRCENCELRKECKAPVNPSAGKYNVMLIGEAPGRNEDKVGAGFVGKAGDVCWNSLERHALYRDMFHVTNVCKCFPSQTRTPKNKHIKACREWLEKEIEAVQPVLALAFGNTCLNFFSGKESGISDLSGKIEWLEKYKMWVCWCIHPASVVYTPENQSTFDEAIDKFAEAIDTLSGEYMVQ